MSDNSIYVGCFVRIRDANEIGKVAAVDEVTKTATVAIFRGISEQIEHQYPLTMLRRTLLEPQMRVYHQQIDYTWTMGRVAYVHHGDSGQIWYAVDFPNTKGALIREHELAVRSLGSAIDPTDVLALGGAESPMLADIRGGLLAAIYAARAASVGLTGLLSGAITLVPHQIEVVQRVLSDHSQRYLLADEVGMGKTIEAGSIIRQCLLDDPTATVVVLAPATLVPQWKDELASRFRSVEFSGRFAVFSHRAVRTLAVSGYDLLVIDEAHRLIPADTSGRTFQHLQAVAQASQRLLLLSATPLIADETATLAMLNLLDPIAYPLDGREALRQKLARRQDYGRLLLKLNPLAHSFILKKMMSELLTTFPDDPVVAELAPLLTAPETERVAAVRELKSHIADTYRLHQRIIRTRRRDVPATFFPPRGGSLKVEVDDDDRMPDICNELEEWRTQANEAISALSGEEAIAYSSAFGQRYLLFFIALGQGVEALSTAIAAEQDQIATHAALTFATEQQQLAAMLLVAARSFVGVSRLELVTDVVVNAIGTLTHPGKVVAFTSDTAWGKRLAARLAVHFPQRRVGTVFADVRGEDLAETVALFQTDPRMIALIADTSAEEGLNLHAATSILHLDLPLDIGRLEQRIGRVDRFGRTLPGIAQRVVIPSDEDTSPWLAWFELLRDGFGIFLGSIAEVQFVLTALEDEIATALFRHGAQGCRELLPRIQERLAQERQRLDEQYALDQLDLQESDTDRFAALQAFETHSERFAAPVQQWLKDGIHFSIRYDDDDADVFSLRWSPHTLIPENIWRVAFQMSLDTPLTFVRSRAMQRTDTALIRPGSWLMNALIVHMEWEDRGKAFAMWRCDPLWGRQHQEPWLGFCLRYTVEADIDTSMPATRLRQNLQRRADDLLPPWVAMVYIGADLAPVTDTAFLAILGRPYSKKRDTEGRVDVNLASRPAIMADLIEPHLFVRLCRTIRTASEEIIRASPAFTVTLASASELAHRNITQHNQQLQRREVASEREMGYHDPDLDQAMAINAALLAAVAQPRITLDAIGFMVVSGNSPEQGR